MVASLDAARGRRHHEAMSASPSKLGGSRLKTIVGYGVMVAAAAGIFVWIRRMGGGLEAPAPGPGITFGQTVPGASSEVLLHVLLAMVVVIVASRGLGMAFRYLQQPPVIGEVIAGIILGPSLLGRVAPQVSGYLLPSTVAPYLGIIAQVGIVLFMFLVGVELDTSLLRKKTHSAVAISHASILTPFLLGSATALWIYPKLSSSDVPFGTFALFMGVSMSVTAFPVLARILTDRGIQKTRLGVIAISCAAVDDVTAWCLLAFVVAVAEARMGGAIRTIGFTLAYVAVMLVAVRPLVARMVRRQALLQKVTQGTTALVLVGLLLSALATEYIGIHALFGAFLLGAIIPHESLLARSMSQKLEDVVVVFLLPAFFAFTGMRTQIGLVSGVLGHLRGHHPGGVPGQVRRHHRGGTPCRARQPRCGDHRRADEHPRPHGAHRAQHRPRPQGALAHPLRHDGHHGAGDHLRHDAGAPLAPARTLPGRTRDLLARRAEPAALLSPPQSATLWCTLGGVGGVAEWFKAPVLKTGVG